MLVGAYLKQLRGDMKITTCLAGTRGYRDADPFVSIGEDARDWSVLPTLARDDQPSCVWMLTLHCFCTCGGGTFHSLHVDWGQPEVAPSALHLPSKPRPLRHTFG